MGFEDPEENAEVMGATLNCPYLLLSPLLQAYYPSLTQGLFVSTVTLPLGLGVPVQNTQLPKVSPARS